VADPKNVIVDIKNGLSDVRQQMNLLKQETAGWVSTLGAGLSRMSGGGRNGEAGVSSTQVAPNPKFTPPAGSPESIAAAGGVGGVAGGAFSGNPMVPYQPMGGNIVANTPSTDANSASNGAGGRGFTGNTNLTRFVGENPAAGALYAAAITSNMLDAPGESVESQLLTARSAYYNNFGKNTPLQAYNNMKDYTGRLADLGTINNKMDVQRGLAAAQSMGVSGPNVTTPNGTFGSVAGGVAVASNLVPGQGFEGTMRAFGSMQQGRNVNMLRGIGIRLRDEQGNLKPPNEIIDDLWAKICRDYSGNYGAGKKPSKQEMQIGLQPGNSMDSMLDLYFGNDPMAKQLIANGLLFKAETGGAAITKEKMLEIGATTNAAQAASNRSAQSTKQTMGTQDAGAAGYTNAANTLAAASKLMTEKMLPVLETLTKTNAYVLTMLGAANGAPEKVIAALMLGGKKAITALLTIAGVATAGVAITDIISDAPNSPFGSGTSDGTSSAPHGLGSNGPAFGNSTFTPPSAGASAAGGTSSAPHGLGSSGSSGANASYYSKAKNEKAVKLHQFLVSQGMSPNAATGVVGNLIVESNLRTDAKGDYINGKPTAFGIAQWREGRQDRLRAYAKKVGLPVDSMEVQQQFIMKELQEPFYKDLVSVLNNPNTTTAEAAKEFMLRFERPKYDTSSARTAAGLNALGLTGASNVSANTGGNTYNYGGVTVKIDAKGMNAQQIADEVKRILELEELAKGATNR
jgi:hypothetical protein